jgi:hypothetical protein
VKRLGYREADLIVSNASKPLIGDGECKSDKRLRALRLLINSIAPLSFQQ